MRALRLSVVALVVSSLAALAWSIGAGGCGPPALYAPNCFQPTPGETGADGGPDPCHCNVNPPYADNSCPCTSGAIFAEGLTGIDIFHECMSLVPPDAGASGGDAGDDAEGGPLSVWDVPDAGDAGDAAEVGPLLACDGACWPLPPPGWAPVLLWTGAESDAGAGLCPMDVAPFVVFDGIANDASGTFAVACASNASGPCPGIGDVCGPTPAPGLQSCVMHTDDLPCASLGPYPEWYVFYEGSAPEPLQPTTFCCTPSPPATM